MKARIVGIDFGLARIGVALSDPMHIIASPFKTIQNNKKLELVAGELIDSLKDYQVEEIVVGMPYTLGGKVGFSADEVLHFIEALKQKTDIPIQTWDERLTTAQTERVMKAGKVSRKKRVNVIDAACATLILQSYLDQKSFKSGRSYDEILANEV